MKKFPDFVPPTKVSYLDRGPTLHVRRCTLQSVDDPGHEWTFDKEEIRIGSMEDNDVVIGDDTVSRYHCKITQEDNGYVLIGGNPRMREIYSIIEKIAPTATTVVIDGETGTGKEVVAQAIHSLSPRSRNDL